MTTPLFSGLIATASLIAACAAQSATPDQPITWTLKATEAQLGKGEAQLGFEARRGRDDRSRTSHSRTFALSALQGLAAADLRTNGSRQVSFRYVQPAGRLDCSGVVRSRAGTGGCGLTADRGFADALASRGIGRPDALQLLNLTMSGVDLAVLDELARQGYPKPDVDGLVGLGIFKVTPDYVRTLAASGYRLRSIGDLVQFKIFKVEPGLIKELRTLDYANLPASQLVQFKIFDVTPKFVRDLSELGYSSVSPGKLVELKIHGITPEYIRSFARAGIARPGIDQLTRMRIAGFDPARRDEAR